MMTFPDGELKEVCEGDTNKSDSNTLLLFIFYFYVGPFKVWLALIE